MINMMSVMQFLSPGPGKGPDVLVVALGSSVVMASSVEAIELWMKIVLLACTIIFVLLGCTMRVMGIRKDRSDDAD